MNRQISRLLAVAMLLSSLVGCGQKVFMTEAEYLNTHTSPALLPPNLENDPHAPLVPASPKSNAPMTVLDVNRPVRYISLPEAIAIALEQGNVGSFSPLNPGIANDFLTSYAGRALAGTDAIRVLALDPAIISTDIESSLSRFDARWLSTVSWNKTDNAVANALQNFQNGDLANVSTGIYKPLPTGGLTGITLSTDYQYLTDPPVFGGTATVNPFYKPRAQFVFEQPLLQNFGVEINQISNTLPSSFLVPGFRPAGGTRTEGILIARLRFDQSRAEFERNINYMLLNVEYAYWNLYGAYFALYSREQGLRYALVSWQVNKTRFDAGRIPIQDLEQVRAQYESFRGQRINAMGRVLEAERQLRGLLGMPIEDGTRLVPGDAPTLSAFSPDWQTAESETLAMRPELVLTRLDLKNRQLDLIVQQNFLRPDLRFFASYDINGIGTRMDGSPLRFGGISQTGAETTYPGNALSSFMDNAWHNWQLGLRMDVPIGFREAHASVRAARLNLARSYFQLKDQEDKAIRFLALQYRNVIQYYQEIQTTHAQRLANARQLEARFRRFQVGAREETIDVLLEAQRNFADALAGEYTAIVNYNNALAGFQFAKGTIQNYNNVSVAEGQLPECVQMRAVEHLREKSAAFKLRERPDPSVFQAELGPAAVPPLTDGNPKSLAEVPLMKDMPAISGNGSIVPSTPAPPVPPTSLPPMPVAPPAAPAESPMPLNVNLPVSAMPAMPLMKDR